MGFLSQISHLVPPMGMREEEDGSASSKSLYEPSLERLSVANASGPEWGGVACKI